MAVGTLVVFWLPPGTSTNGHNKFRFWCYGREVSSWGGRYRYWRPGVLERFPHVLLYTGVLIVGATDGRPLARLLGQKGAKVVIREVGLTKADQRRLRRRSVGPG